MKTLSHILLLCRTIPYLITWQEDPSRLSAAIVYLNTCGSSTPPPPDKLRLLLLMGERDRMLVAESYFSE